MPGAETHALPLRTLADAIRLRDTLARQVQRAANACGLERKSLLTFLVVGGGYTGVEFAGELAARLPVLARRFGVGHDEIRIALLEATARILQQMAVDIFVNAPVRSVDADGVALEGGRVRARTVIWTTGSRAPRWLAEAGLQVGQAGRARVDAHLAAIGHPEIAILGDAALAHDPSGVQLPASAQVAVQQAKYLADRLLGRPTDERSFVPHVLGEALSLGPIEAWRKCVGCHSSIGQPCSSSGWRTCATWTVWEVQRSAWSS